MLETTIPTKTPEAVKVVVPAPPRALSWKDFFSFWPAGLPRRGLVINTLNEVMPFKSFLIKDDLLLIERTNPDPLGARYILLNFGTITSVKLIDPLKESIFTDAGFSGKFSAQ